MEWGDKIILLAVTANQGCWWSSKFCTCGTPDVVRENCYSKISNLKVHYVNCGSWYEFTIKNNLFVFICYLIT